MAKDCSVRCLLADPRGVPAPIYCSPAETARLQHREISQPSSYGSQFSRYGVGEGVVPSIGYANVAAGDAPGEVDPVGASDDAGVGLGLGAMMFSQ